MAGWLASCLSFMVSARLSCSSIIGACSNNLKQHSTEFTREPCTQINSETPRLTKGVNYARGGYSSWQRGLERSLHDRRPNKFSFKTIMAENADMEGRRLFALFYVSRRPNMKKRFLLTLLMDLLDIRRRDVWTVHGWHHLSLFGTAASLVSFKLRDFSSDQPAASLIFST